MDGKGGKGNHPSISKKCTRNQFSPDSVFSEVFLFSSFFFSFERFVITPGIVNNCHLSLPFETPGKFAERGCILEIVSFEQANLAACA